MAPTPLNAKMENGDWTMSNPALSHNSELLEPEVYQDHKMLCGASAKAIEQVIGAG